MDVGFQSAGDSLFPRAYPDSHLQYKLVFLCGDPRTKNTSIRFGVSSQHNNRTVIYLYAQTYTNRQRKPNRYNGRG